MPKYAKQSLILKKFGFRGDPFYPALGPIRPAFVIPFAPLWGRMRITLSNVPRSPGLRLHPLQS